MLQDQMSGIDVQTPNRTRLPVFVNLKLYVWVMEKLLEAVQLSAKSNMASCASTSRFIFMPRIL